MDIPEEVKKKVEYQQFIEWMGLPSPERVPAEQKELCLELDVIEATLSNWKKVKGFWDLVRIERKAWAKDKVSDVLMGVYRKAVLEGNAAEAKLFLKYAEEFEEKLLIEANIIRELSEEDEELIKKAIEYGGIKGKSEDNNREQDKGENT